MPGASGGSGAAATRGGCAGPWLETASRRRPDANAGRRARVCHRRAWLTNGTRWGVCRSSCVRATGSPGEGDQPLGLDAPRDGVLYVPETAEPGAPLLIFLHGAMGAGHAHLRAVLAAVDRYGVILVAPDSRGPTWDLIAERRFGPHVAFHDRVLDALADRGGRRHRAAGDRRGVRRGVLRAVDRVDQRRRVPDGAGLLARLSGRARPLAQLDYPSGGSTTTSPPPRWGPGARSGQRRGGPPRPAPLPTRTASRRLPRRPAGQGDVDPDEAVIRAREREVTHQAEQWVLSGRPEYGGVDDA